MEIALPAGGVFVLDFPVYVLMLAGPGGKRYLKPVAFPVERAVFVYTEDDLAQRGIENQQLTEMAAVPIATEGELRNVVERYERAGASNVALDVCTQPGTPGGHCIPIPLFLGRAQP